MFKNIQITITWWWVILKTIKALLLSLTLIVQIALVIAIWKGTFATHTDCPLHKSWSGKPYPPQLKIYSLLNMCWYAPCIITSITGQVWGQSHTSFLFRDRRALCLPQSHHQVLLGFQIKSHHPFSTATHCPPPQRRNILEIMPGGTSKTMAQVSACPAGEPSQSPQSHNSRMKWMMELG